MKKLLPAMAASFSLVGGAAFPDAAEAKEFRQRLSTGREVLIDCKTLFPDNDVLKLTGGFISQYDVPGEMAGLNDLTQTQRNLVAMATANRTTEPVVIRFVMEHVINAHGV